MQPSLVQRLRDSVTQCRALDRSQLLEEAAAEIERLRLTEAERTAIVFIAHNNPKDGFVRRTWLEFKGALCGLLERHR